MSNERNTQSELEALQLEETRYRIQELRGVQQNREIRKRSIEESLRADRSSRERAQAWCWHKKGGMGVESLMQGNDANYAVVKHILPTGPMIVICQRCMRIWEPPDKKLISKGASPEDRRLYSKLAKEYQDAVAFPTDNQTSGSQIFVVTDTREAA